MTIMSWMLFGGGLIGAIIEIAEMIRERKALQIARIYYLIFFALAATFGALALFVWL
jgi:hypothetical protein